MHGREISDELLSGCRSVVQSDVSAEDGGDELDDVGTALARDGLPQPPGGGEERLCGFLRGRLLLLGRQVLQGALAALLGSFEILATDALERGLALGEFVQAPKRPREVRERIPQLLVARGAELSGFDEALESVSQALWCVAARCDAVSFEDPGEVADVAASTEYSRAQRGAWAGCGAV